MCDREAGLSGIIHVDPSTLYVVYGPECEANLQEVTHQPNITLEIPFDPSLLPYEGTANVIRAMVFLLLVVGCRAILRWIFPRRAINLQLVDEEMLNRARARARAARQARQARLQREREARVRGWDVLGRQEQARREGAEEPQFPGIPEEALVAARIPYPHPFEAENIDPEYARYAFETAIRGLELPQDWAQYNRGILERLIQFQEEEARRAREEREREVRRAARERAREARRAITEREQAERRAARERENEQRFRGYLAHAELMERERQPLGRATWTLRQDL